MSEFTDKDRERVEKVHRLSYGLRQAEREAITRLLAERDSLQAEVERLEQEVSMFAERVSKANRLIHHCRFDEDGDLSDDHAVNVFADMRAILLGTREWREADDPLNPEGTEG